MIALRLWAHLSWRRTQAAGITLALALTVSGTAFAQFSAGGDGPIDLAADSISNQGNVTVLEGQVDVRQGGVRVLADKMQIFSGGDGAALGGAFNDINRVVARGNFYYITDEQEVRGEQGVYEQASDTFTVSGSVILLQGEDNIITGDRLIYNLSQNEARMESTCKGRRCGSAGRVKALIKSRNTNADQTTSGS